MVLRHMREPNAMSTMKTGTTDTGDPRQDPEWMKGRRADTDTGKIDGGTRTYNLGEKPYGLKGDLIVSTRASYRFLLIGLISGEGKILFRTSTWGKARTLIRNQFKRMPERRCWLIDQKEKTVAALSADHEGFETGWLRSADETGKVFVWDKSRSWITQEELLGEEDEDW